MKRAALGAAIVALLLPGAAAAQAPPAKVSDGVSHVGFVPEPGIISARFRDGLMYVSSARGLSVYDVTNPEAPSEIGRLDLPHFENEDVDLGGNTLLISQDPAITGVGRLYVIDISNPAEPTQVGEINTGTIDSGIITGVLPSPLNPGFGTGHTATCVDRCRYAYLAGPYNGIDIVDLTVPWSAPVYVGRFLAPEANNEKTGTGLAVHDVQFDGRGNALMSGGGGVAAYDVANPLEPSLVYRTDDGAKSNYVETAGVNDGSTVNDFIHHNAMRLKNSDIAAGGGPAADDSDVLAITEEDYNRPTCQGAGSFQTWRIEGTIAHLLDRWDVEIDPTRQSLCSAHYFDIRGGLLAQGWYEQGTRFLDVSDPADIRQVGYWIPNKALTWGGLFPPTDPTGEIVYSLDNPRGIDVLRFDRPGPGEPPRPTVVAPPGNAPEDGSDPSSGGGGSSGGGTGPSGSASSIRPNVALTVSDRRTRVRRGVRSSYFVTVRHVAGAAARDIEVLLRLPRGLLRRGRTRVFRRLPELAPRASRTWRVRVRVPRRARRRSLVAQARMTLADDANPRDNLAVDRTSVRSARRRRGAALSRAERDHLLAKNMALLPTVRAPRKSGAARQIPQQRTAYGYVCRI